MTETTDLLPHDYSYILFDANKPDRFMDCRSCYAEAPLAWGILNYKPSRYSLVCEVCSVVCLEPNFEYEELTLKEELTQTMCAIANLIMDKTTDRTTVKTLARVLSEYEKKVYNDPALPFKQA